MGILDTGIFGHQVDASDQLLGRHIDRKLLRLVANDHEPTAIALDDQAVMKSNRALLRLFARLPSPPDFFFDRRSSWMVERFP